MKNMSLTLPELMEVLANRFVYNLQNPASQVRPLYIEGHAGIGKTQTIRQLAIHLTSKIGEKVDCQILNLQFCERPDFMGLPTISPSGQTVFARPNFLPSSGKGILFLDEANRVDSDIQSGMLTLIEDRNINGHRLGDGWMIVLAGNPATTNANVRYAVSTFDHALNDRLAKITAVPKLSDLQNYLAKKYNSHKLLQILDYCPEIVSFDGDGCTPRSFEYALRATILNQDLGSEIFEKTLSIELGVPTAKHIIAVLKEGYLPTLKGLLNGDKRVYEFMEDNPLRQDVIINLINQIFNFVTDIAESGAGLSSTSTTSIIEFLMMIKDEHRLVFFERVKHSKHSAFFAQHLLKNTKLTETLHARRATNS